MLRTIYKKLNWFLVHQTAAREIARHEKSFLALDGLPKSHISIQPVENKIIPPDWSPELTNSQSLRNAVHNYHIPEGYYFWADKARIVRNQAYDLSSSNCCFLECLPDHPIRPHRIIGLKAWDYFRAKTYPRRSRRELDSVFLLSTAYHFNYFHFTFDILVKLANFLEETGFDPAKLTFLVDGPLRRWQNDLLTMIGIDTDKQIRNVGKKVVDVENLLLISPRRFQNTQYSTKALINYRRRALADADVSKTNSPNLYVSRRLANKRRIVNEAELIKELEKRDFQIVDAEKLTAKEQVSLFSNAKLIVAPHGAGLTNVVYSTEPTVVELFPYDGLNLGFYIAVTHAVDGSYIPIFGQRQNDLDDFQVPVSRILDYVDQALFSVAN